jgi:hypothetical protein
MINIRFLPRLRRSFLLSEPNGAGIKLPRRAETGGIHRGRERVPALVQRIAIQPAGAPRLGGGPKAAAESAYGP